MIVRCADCKRHYDDAACWTICPHGPLWAGPTAYCLQHDLVHCHLCLVAKENDPSPCGLCGAPHPFDTSVESDAWNRVIRARGLPEFLCLACIIIEFTKAGESLTAQLWGDKLNGVRIEVTV